MNSCPECGAAYSDSSDLCATRFAILLALDHSRQEPWGSRHGQAFAAFALQHPAAYPRSLDRAWAALFQIYVAGEDPPHVFAALRTSGRRQGSSQWNIPPRGAHALRMPTVTIAHMGDFAADAYPDRLDAWCRASLESWGLSLAPASRGQGGEP